jgi:TonB-dependent receptor-like protein
VFTFGGRSAEEFGLAGFPGFSPIQAYGLGVPSTLVQGAGNPRDSFRNIPLGLYWQDSWRVSHNLTFNYGVRYDVEFPPKFSPPTGMALAAYNQLGIQKGIKTDRNNFQPRIGVAWDPSGNGKSVVRASYGLFYDHPLLGLYFLGDASDASKTVQLVFPGSSPCSTSVAAGPSSMNATNIFQGILTNSNCLPTVPGYLPQEQRFDAANANLFLNQTYLQPSTFFPLAFQPFGYPQAKGFEYAFSHQANLTVERDLGHNMSLSLAYNFNGGRHLNRPINANTPRGDLLVKNWLAAVANGAALPTDNPLFVSACGVGPGGAYVPPALVNFFRPSGMNPAIGLLFMSGQVPGGAGCAGLAQQVLQAAGLNANCDLATLAGCVPFSDMDANFSNGSSVYHGFTTNLRKRFGGHTAFQASYTWSHAIDDSTDLQSPLAPQDSFYPFLERSNSLFDQRHRFVFSGTYQTGKLAGDGFASKLFSNWTFAPIIEVASGRPFNILTGNQDNFQFSPSTGRPNVVPAGSTSLCGPTVPSRYSPSGYFQEPCYANFLLGGTPTLISLDGNFPRNGGLKPWTLFNDIRVSRLLNFGERMSLEMSADIFNIANRFSIADVNQLFTNAGEPTSSYDPRQFQFGLKLKW